MVATSDSSVEFVFAIQRSRSIIAQREKSAKRIVIFAADSSVGSRRRLAKFNDYFAIVLYPRPDARKPSSKYPLDKEYISVIIASYNIVQDHVSCIVPDGLTFE